MTRYSIIPVLILVVSGLLFGCGTGENAVGLVTTVGGTGGVDTTPPTVLSTSPTSSATGVGTGAVISARFSETMDASSLVAGSTFVVRIDGGATVAGTVLLIGGVTAVFSPSTALLGNTVYRALITSGVRDLSGLAMLANYEWTFTTTASADTTPPTVVSVSPTNGATNVSVNTNIAAVFSEALDSTTVVSPSTNFSVSGVSGNVTYASGVSTFNPSVALASGTTYTATLIGGPTGIADVSLNRLASNYIWSFTTAPAPTITTTTLPDGSETAAYSTTLAATGGITPYAYAIISGTTPTGISLDGAGVLSGTPVAGTAADSPYTFTVRLTDSDGLTDTQALTLNILAGPVIGTVTLPDATESGAYSQTLSASGGTPPYTWNATGLPSGLLLNASSGVLSGTLGALTSSGSPYTVDVTLTDSLSATDTQSISLVVNVPPVVTTSSLPVGYVGVAYGPVSLTATGGTTPYASWSATPDPPIAGLTFNTSTGTISGTPTVAGSPTVDFTVTDTYGVVSLIQSLGLNVYDVPAAPTGVTATPGGLAGQIDVSWTASTGATSYTVYYDNAGSVTLGSSNISTSATFTTLSSLTTGSTYSFAITATNPAGTSGLSSPEVSATAP